MGLIVGCRPSGRRVRRWLRLKDGLSTLIGLGPRDRDLLAWHAHRRLTLGAVDEAEALYRALLALWPGLALARLGLGACLQSKGDLEAAEAAYADVLASDPADLFALTNRAEVRLLLGRPHEALADLDTAQSLPPRLLQRSRLTPRLNALRTIALDRLQPGA
jgi:tetratricopeptide (TPR) repeat protein